MTNEVTVEGVTYRRGEKLNAIPLDGTWFFTEQGNLMQNTPTKGFTGTPDGVYFDLSNPTGVGRYYEAIVVETPVAKKQPEWREVKVVVAGALEDADNPLKFWKYYQEALTYALTETLKASRIRIHNVDGSVTEYTKNPASGWGYEYKHSWGGSQKITISPEEMQVHTQSAFMRGSKVEVLG